MRSYERRHSDFSLYRCRRQFIANNIAINCITASEQFWLFSRLNFCVVRGRTLSFVSTYVFQKSSQSASISFETAVLSTNPLDLFEELFGDCVRHFCFSGTMISDDKIERKVRRGFPSVVIRTVTSPSNTICIGRLVVAYQSVDEMCLLLAVPGIVRLRSGTYLFSKFCSWNSHSIFWG